MPSPNTNFQKSICDCCLLIQKVAEKPLMKPYAMWHYESLIKNRRKLECPALY